MAWPDDPRDLKVGFAFGHNDAEDPSLLTFETVSPNVDDEGDPGPVLESVRISRGRTGDAPTTDPTSIETSLRDTEGDFSPRNVSGAYYGQLLRGTPVRASVDVGSGDVALGTAFVPSWSPTWRGPDMDDQVPIQALGMLAKLGRDREALSAPVRYIPGTSPVAYWPLEDGELATASAPLVGSHAMRPFTGTHPSGAVITYPQWGRGDLGPWLKPVVSRSGTSGLTVLWSPVEMSSSATTWTVDLMYASGTDAGTASVDDVSLVVDANPSYLPGPFAAAGWPQLGFVPVAEEMYVTLGGEPEVGFSTPNLYDGLGHHIRWTVSQSGSNGAWSVWVDGELVGSGATTNPMTVNPMDAIGLAAPSSAGSQIAHGHVAVWTSPPTLADAASAALGHRGEQAHERIDRLAAENGLPIVITGSESTLMGPQPVDTVLGIWRDCEATDHGILYERRDGRMAYKTRRSLYNLTPALELDFGDEEEPDGDVSDLTMLDDDRDLYNLVTVTNRSTGTSATAEQTDGEVGTDQVGPRPLPVTLNLATDDALADHAGWLLRAGTVDKPRFVLVLDLYSKPSLAATVTACDIGSRVTVTGAPAKHVGPDDLDLIVEGEVLDFDATKGLVMWWCEPYDLWDIGTYQDTDASGDVPRYDTEWSTSATGLYLPDVTGVHASTPDHANLDITGNIDIRFDGRLVSWASGSEQTLVDKYNTTGNQRSYTLRLDGSGFLVFRWSTDGTTVLTATSTAAVTAAPGDRLAVRVAMNVNDGAQRVVVFYTAPTMDDTFVQLGVSVTGAVTSIFNSTAVLTVGEQGAGGLRAIGLAMAAQVRNGINGTVVANPVFTAEATDTTSFADSAGRTWTVAAGATIYGAFSSGMSTKMLVRTSDGPLWTISPPGGFPILTRVAGAVLSVTNITGSTLLQPFTVSTTVPNGVEKFITSGSAVRVFRPPHYGL